MLPADYILSLLRHYDASSIAPNQLAILKTPKPDTTGMSRSRLRQEARILAALRHPHIVAYVGQTARPTPGVFVQYFVGGSLRDRIRWHQVHGYVFVFTSLAPKIPLLLCCTDFIDLP
jgi:serine/threonine protein kinase